MRKIKIKIKIERIKMNGIKKVLQKEKDNDKYIYLYKNNDFYNAYEVSAFAVREYLWKNIKVMCGIDEKGGGFLRVGFPCKSLEKVLIEAKKNKIEVIDGGEDDLEMTLEMPVIKSEDYQKWRELYFTKISQVKEQMKPFYGGLPVYKLAYDLLSLVVGTASNLPRELRQALGWRLVDKIIEVNIAFREVAKQEKSGGEWKLAIEEIEDKFNDLMFLLRLAFDQRTVGVERSQILVEGICSINQQLAAWKKSKKVKKGGKNA
jgi:hypothetical protein